jgi:NADH dehydrogenase FAD-containing subunit
MSLSVADLYPHSRTTLLKYGVLTAPLDWLHHTEYQCNHISPTMSTKNSVVVIGGGGAGSSIARILSQKLDSNVHTLTLVTARPFFTHLPALVRMTTTSQGKLEEKAFIPYDKIFANNNGTLKIGRVAAIEAKEGKGGVVVLESGERVAYDVLVLAPGSQWSGPLNVPDDRQAALVHVKEWRRKFETASSIVLAGGGAVGLGATSYILYSAFEAYTSLEYAGEIKDFFPNTKVTIVHSAAEAMNNTYPDKFRKRLEKDFRARGVDFIFNDYIDDFEQTGTITTRNGKQIGADLVVRTCLHWLWRSIYVLQGPCCWCPPKHRVYRIARPERFERKRPGPRQANTPARCLPKHICCR